MEIRLLPFLEGFYADLNINIDQQVFGELTSFYAQSLDKKYIPTELNKMLSQKDGVEVAEHYYGNSLFKNLDEIRSTMNMNPEQAVVKIKNDPLYQLGEAWHDIYVERISAPYNREVTKLDSLQRIYMKAQMETFKDKRFWPDANSTMRVTYGQVRGYEPRDAVYYNSKSYTKGIREKYVEGDYEFDVPEKLLELIDEQDFGQYKDESGDVPVCFIGTNHTTGGNSGSPAIDAYGNLVGLNFDRVWEGTMSDLNYDASICRNIMVDARYILFIVDKFAGAEHLIEEMKLVRPKHN